jgi:hypothetical protein
VLGELRDIVEDDLVGVSLLIEIFLVGVGHDATDDLGHGVVELRVTTELLPLLGVLMLICHCCLLSIFYLVVKEASAFLIYLKFII